MIGVLLIRKNNPPASIGAGIKTKKNMARNILIAGAGVTAISQERDRQIQVEGWTPEHDAQHSNGELAKAAGCYALAEDAREKCNGDISEPFKFWPWAKEWWKPSSDDRIKELAKAGALIAAEIDRLVELQSEKNTHGTEQ